MGTRGSREASAPDPATNHLLAALPAEMYARLRPRLVPVRLAAGHAIYEAGAAMTHVYFPLTGVASVLFTTGAGELVETGTIGREGLVGLPAFHGVDRTPLATLVQVPGHFARLPLPTFQAAAVEGSALHRLLHRYAQAYAVLVAVSAGCNLLHPVEGRCARWLLVTHDRVGAATLPLTHQLLGHLLGVNRSAVTLAAGALQRAGLITYRRGAVTIRDRPGLEAAACECYATIRDEFARLLGAP